VPREYWDAALLAAGGALAVGAACWLSVDVRRPVFPSKEDT
jgi:hypothetical protein